MTPIARLAALLLGAHYGVDHRYTWHCTHCYPTRPWPTCVTRHLRRVVLVRIAHRRCQR